jgi:hypothetical protein
MYRSNAVRRIVGEAEDTDWPTLAVDPSFQEADQDRQRVALNSLLACTAIFSTNE